MKTIQEWLSEYAVSHQNPTNKKVHFVCVPVIFFTVVGLFYSIPLGTPNTLTEGLVAKLLLVAVTVYYLSMSKSLAAGMLLYGLLCLWACHLIMQYVPVHLALVSFSLFVLAWIAQFWGHKVEGAKPSFLKDLQFLMIGPAWIMSFIYKKLGLSL